MINVNVEQLVKWKVGEETEVLGENLPYFHLGKGKGVPVVN
jgi:hypothetical protein